MIGYSAPGELLQGPCVSISESRDCCSVNWALNLSGGFAGEASGQLISLGSETTEEVISVTKDSTAGLAKPNDCLLTFT